MCGVPHDKERATVRRMQSTNNAALVLRRLAAVVVAFEALALVGVAVVAGVGAITDDGATEISVAIAVTAVVFAVPLALACRALWQGRSWPRGLVLTWQVLQVAAGYTLLDWSVAAGLVAIVVAVVCGVLVFFDARKDTSHPAGDA